MSPGRLKQVGVRVKCNIGHPVAVFSSVGNQIGEENQAIPEATASEPDEEEFAII